ncbi:hypothetical protein LI951_14830 [Enterococcus sp. BWT-B8]|uniref:hypothetical protein n=1 Tax=Enterococcus sp. BWT-B8 TaxID=2885157 RepID=UPI001E443C5B|nr:hypothetical protein [Enterococcus sp. BWT-B8]MCB5953342.1 hypothetical protein [Enterococcus sp. BWT-B8]
MIRSNVEMRNTFFKKLFGEKAPKQEWIDLRNSLAHDIESSTIVDGTIIYENLKTKTEENFFIDDLFMKQLEFAEELQDIMGRC